MGQKWLKWAGSPKFHKAELAERTSLAHLDQESASRVDGSGAPAFDGVNMA
jgi:hypothetical protein